ncbi:ATP-binding protein [bacterium]|nr:ATP-binding protein [bacterium]
MIARTLASALKELFQKYPVITLTGPRQSGKTTLCRATFPDLPYVNLEALDERQFAAEDPRGFLAQFPDGAIFDEFQRAPELTSYLQVQVDEERRNGMFVLTGSQNLQVANTVSQSLAGRTAVLNLLPLSLSELSVSYSELSINELIFRGGYPRIFEQALSPSQAMRDYVATYVERDLRELSNIDSLPDFQRFIRLCAGRVGQIMNYENLGNEVGVSGPTIKRWIGLLESTFLSFSLRPYFRNVSKRIIKSPKFYFSDVGLACYLLGIESPEQLESHPLRGALFENLAVLECLKHRFHSAKSNNLFYYRDSKAHEVDIILEQAHAPLLLEVKFSKTLCQSFQKGFQAFIDATSFQNADKILVYDGEPKKSAYGMEVVNVHHLHKLLTEKVR